MVKQNEELLDKSNPFVNVCQEKGFCRFFESATIVVKTNVIERTYIEPGTILLDRRYVELEKGFTDLKVNKKQLVINITRDLEI